MTSIEIQRGREAPGHAIHRVVHSESSGCIATGYVAARLRGMRPLHGSVGCAVITNAIYCKRAGYIAIGRRRYIASAERSGYIAHWKRAVYCGLGLVPAFARGSRGFCARPRPSHKPSHKFVTRIDSCN